MSQPDTQHEKIVGVDWIPDSATELQVRIWTIWRRAATALGFPGLSVRWADFTRDESELTVRLIVGEPKTFEGEIWYPVDHPGQKSDDELYDEAVEAIARKAKIDRRWTLGPVCEESNTD